MERDINVVAQVKEDGSVGYKTGDGLPLDIGGGGEVKHLYKHTVRIADGAHGIFMDIYNDTETPFSVTNSPFPVAGFYPGYGTYMGAQELYHSYIGIEDIGGGFGLAILSDGTTSTLTYTTEYPDRISDTVTQIL